MGLVLSAQAVSLLIALAGGLALGLLYDLLRPIRRRGGDTLWDLLFCLAAAICSFLFAMRSESGTLGTMDLAASLAGLLLYFRLLSPFAFPIFENLAQNIEGFSFKAQVSAKKVLSDAKKLFQISRG